MLFSIKPNEIPFFFVLLRGVFIIDETFVVTTKDKKKL